VVVTDIANGMLAEEVGGLRWPRKAVGKLAITLELRSNIARTYAHTQDGKTTTGYVRVRIPPVQQQVPLLVILKFHLGSRPQCRVQCPPPFPHQRSVMLTSVLQDALTNMVVKYMQIVHTIVPKGVQ